MQNKTLGDKIRGIRVLKDLSQENLASMLEMSVRGYGDIERGVTDVSFSRLEQIADKLGVQVSDILAYGDRVSYFFDQCNSVGVNSGGQTVNNFDQQEIKHQIEKLQLELKLMQAEKEKAEIEAKYWREKGE